MIASNEYSRWLARLEWHKLDRWRRWASHPLRALMYHRRQLEVAALRATGQTEMREAELFWGRRMKVTPPEIVSSAIYCRGYFEEGLTEALFSFLKSGMTVIDVGAHLGYVSLLASDLVGDSGSVHAFEPTPSTLDLLSLNLAPLSNAVVVPLAAYSSRGRVAFNDFGPKWSAFNSFVSPRTKSTVGVASSTIEVETVTIDDYVASKKLRPDFIKIDAESTEFEVLAGMHAVMSLIRPILSIEVGDEGGQKGRSRALIEHIMSFSYLPFEYRSGVIARHAPKDAYTYDNLVMLPEVYKA